MMKDGAEPEHKESENRERSWSKKKKGKNLDWEHLHRCHAAFMSLGLLKVIADGVGANKKQ